MARRTKEDAAKTRLKILRAALDLFSSKGYEKTTFENIADRIKLTKGAVYWHFSNKPELLRQLIVYMIDEVTGDQRVITFQPETFEELRCALKDWVSRVLDNPRNRKHVKMLFSLDWSRPGLRDVKNQFKELDNSIMNVTATALRKMRERGEIKSDFDINTVAYSIALTWIGIMHCQLSVVDNDYNINEVLDFTMDSVGKSILVRE